MVERVNKGTMGTPGTPPEPPSYPEEFICGVGLCAMEADFAKA